MQKQRTQQPESNTNVYDAISRYCDYQDRCIQEVRLKLKRLGTPDSDSDALIDQLLDEDLINEERFALSYARGKFRIKHWGRIRIRRELKSKGINPAHISKAMDVLDPDTYHKKLHEVAIRKLEKLPSGTVQSQRKKLWDALIYRGWEKELVYEKIRELLP